jgi:O-antigen ligase
MAYEFLLAGATWLVERRRTIAVRVIVLLMCAGMLILGVLTSSRGPFVALLAALISVVLVMPRAPSIKVVCVVGLLLILAMSLLARGSYKAKEHFTERTGSGRITYYETVLKAKPTLFGHGVGSFHAATGTTPQYTQYIEYPHNSLLEAYFELGVVGAGLLVWALVVTGWRSWQAAARSGRPLTLFPLVMLVFGVVTSLFSGSLFGHGPLSLGLLLACGSYATSPPDAFRFAQKGGAKAGARTREQAAAPWRLELSKLDSLENPVIQVLVQLK